LHLVIVLPVQLHQVRLRMSLQEHKLPINKLHCYINQSKKSLVVKINFLIMSIKTTDHLWTLGDILQWEI